MPTTRKKKSPRKSGQKKRTASARGTAKKSKAVAMSETVVERTKRAKKVVAALRKEYPDADCALEHVDAYQLLIATILSAQSTDETVNKVTPVLFERYKTPGALADADSADVEEIIRSTGFFRQKAKSIQGAARKIADNFGGQVPQVMDDLVTLPGVARKTANVVLGTAFGKNDGIVVDTHIGRISTLLALTWTSKDSKDAVKIEKDLMDVIPQKEWTFFAHALIWHGRRVCKARKPDCDSCVLAKLCPSAHSQQSR